MSDGEVQPRVLRNALKRLGWQSTGTFRDRIEYWEPATRELRGPIQEVVLPLRDDLSDSALLVHRALLALHSEYGQEFDQVVQMVEAMVSRQLDEVLSRRETGNKSGVIAWKDGDSMVEGTRGLLVAAAKATSHSRRRFLNNDTAIAEAFLDKCLMGQTQIGSYVVTALTPAHGKFSTSAPEAKEAAKAPAYAGRTITSTLQTALGAVVESVHEVRHGGSVEAFDTHVTDGVSLELLKALAKIVGDAEASVAVHYNNDDVLDVPELDQHGASFEFVPPDAIVLADAVRHFESAPEPKLVAISGEVVQLHRVSSKPDRTIQLSARVNGVPRVVQVSLTPEQYELALEAHAREVQLSVTGEMEQRARNSTIPVATYVKAEDVPVKRANLANESPLPFFTDLGSAE
ncbi:hypothetical protein [Microbacterium sp. RURRCA19A]|uniref:hypothetical protein n=1 Tax=Microbacterium sp. RURRCA19A TaxID=1907391 RepID=UPI000954ACAE|nr:hypothetical protein [Microbacterium sp. RURRCA19A]SIS12940.1 hypothetical protein SAMN05880568_2897 [Microbacterium sp. RURRCA19A]